MDDFPADRCVAAGEALDLLAAEHDRRGTFGSYEVCRKQALETLVGRLRNGTLAAWSIGCCIDSTIDTGGMAPGELVSTWDYHRTIGGPAPVPVEFWMHFYAAGEDRRSFDPVASDFSFDYVDAEYSSRDGYAYAVHLDHRGLPPIAVPTFVAGWQDPANSVGDHTSTRTATAKAVSLGEEALSVARDLAAKLAAVEAERDELHAKLAEARQAAAGNIAALLDQQALAREVIERLRAELAEAQAVREKLQTAPVAAAATVSPEIRPAPAPAALTAWWDWLDDEARALPQADLLDLCRSAFPRNSISREAVRNLSGPRKRGPKPRICVVSR